MEPPGGICRAGCPRAPEQPKGAASPPSPRRQPFAPAAASSPPPPRTLVLVAAPSGWQQRRRAPRAKGPWRARQRSKQPGSLAVRRLLAPRACYRARARAVKSAHPSHRRPHGRPGQSTPAANSSGSRMETQELPCLAPLQVHGEPPAASGGGSMSDAELAGCSPTSSTHDSARDFYSGPGGKHVARLQPPHRRALKWLARRVNSLQGKQGQGLPAGGSYDSLASLDDLAGGGGGVDSHPLCLPAGQQQAPRAEAAAGEEEQGRRGPRAATAEAAQGGGALRRLARAVLRPFVRLACAYSRAGPQGPGSNDNSPGEAVLNVLTSLPFMALGLHGLSRHFCLSFVAVGVAAAAYHGASPSSRVRPLLRKVDYIGIAYASNALRRAAHITLPRPALLAALLVAPLKPTAVTGLNLALVEGKFLSHALEHAHLRPSFKLHLWSAVAGFGCFWFEDIANAAGWPAVLHSAWHCLSALAMGCTQALLAHLEVPLLLEGVQLGLAA